jgi:hypothetical protein
VIITDDAGRQWRVHDYQVIAGKSSRHPLAEVSGVDSSRSTAARSARCY